MISLLFKKENPMTTQLPTTYRTSFDRYAPCDRPTYKKLKRIRHLLTFAQVMARRWTRAQRRLPHNRVFRRGRDRKPVTDALIFGPFFQPALFELYLPRTGLTIKETRAHPTPLLAQFLADYQNARTPISSPAQLQPLHLSPHQIDALLTPLEDWYRTTFLPW
jgi:hypothetical protein